MRWAEMSVFTSVMRTHEGNRPRDNVQIDQDPQVLAHFARMTRLYVHLAPYLRTLSAAAEETGLPVQRPLFLHHEDDRDTYAIQDSYLYGKELLVAPVWQAGQQERLLYLPNGVDWIHVWSGEAYAGGQEISIAAPVGEPPVFYRADASFAATFATLAEL
jgi:alpha-glucosidase